MSDSRYSPIVHCIRSGIPLVHVLENRSLLSLSLSLLLQDASPLCDNVQSIVSLLLPRVVSTVDFSSYSCNSARQAMLDLHSKEKTVEYTDNLMVC